MKLSTKAIHGDLKNDDVYKSLKFPVYESVAFEFESSRAIEDAFLVKLKREVYRNTGGCLSPHNAYLQLLGLETLVLRIEKSCMNALILSERLSNHPKIRRVNYPGLKNSIWYNNARKYLKDFYGSIFTLELSDKKECFKFMDSLRLIRRATNLHDNKTLAIHPASTIFCEYSLEEREKLGVGEGMVRIACGIEDVDDLYEDIINALEVV